MTDEEACLVPENYVRQRLFSHSLRLSDQWWLWNSAAYKSHSGCFLISEEVGGPAQTHLIQIPGGRIYASFILHTPKKSQEMK